MAPSMYNLFCLNNPVDGKKHSIVFHALEIKINAKISWYAESEVSQDIFS